MLNGVIFLGSILFFNWAIEPALSMLRRLLQEEEAWATDFIGASFSVLYKVLWIYPIYCISFVLNTVMYQEVADGALVLLKQRPSAAAPPLDRLIDETFRVLLNFVYIIEINVLYYLPVVGPPLYFVHSCWLASIYCFEYRWVHLRWKTEVRLDYFERHWLYFAGFGFPVSVVSFLCPRFVDAGVFALLFPLCILTATTAEPQAIKTAPAPLRRLPIFMVVQGVSCRILRIFEGRISGEQHRTRTPSGRK
jgi:etoposide-induced 2.4 mRNA